MLLLSFWKENSWIMVSGTSVTPLWKNGVLLGTRLQPNQLRGKLWKPFRDKDLFFLVVLSSSRVVNKQVASKVTSIALSVQVLDGLCFRSDRVPKNCNFKLICHISKLGVIMLFHKTSENANKMLHVKICWLDERKWKLWTRNEHISNSILSICFISSTFEVVNRRGLMNCLNQPL